MSRSYHKHHTPEQRLNRARRFYDRGRFSAAARDAQALYREVPAGTAFELRAAARLLATFAYARAGEYERGWQVIEAADPARTDTLDLCYVACFLAYQRGDYDATETWGTRYRDLHSQVDPRLPFNHTHDKLHEILNTLGSAAKDRGEDCRAVELFDQTIADKSDYHLPYLNAALVCRRGGDAERAGRYIADGLAQCGLVDDLLLIRDGVIHDRKISLCMIVKDEEEMLDGALASVRSTVDEIIVVDTGSTDGTVDIARAHGARVYHHAWENDFAKARNQSLSYATGDWILILDADERLHSDSVSLVRKVSNSCLQEAVSFSLYNIDLDTDHVSFLPSIRMFRNGRGYVYRGIVHNQIDLPPGTPVLRAPVRIDHYGYTPSLAEKRGKFERTTDLLRRQLKENPDDAFAHFNMAQVMRGREQGKTLAPDIVRHARRVTEILTPQETEHVHILLMGYHQLATALFHLEQYEEAEQACRDALAIKTDYIDALMTLGHILSQRKRYDEAREAFLSYLRVRGQYNEADETSGFILLNLQTMHQAYYGLGQVEEALANLPVALEWYCKVLVDRDDYLEAHLRIGRICYRLGRFDEAREAFTKELGHRSDSFWAHFCLGDIAAYQGEWPRAREHYQNAHGVRPDHPDLPFNLASAAFHTGALDEAATLLAQAQPEVQAEPGALKLAARIASARGDEGAADRWEQLLAIEPGDATAWSDLGNVHFRAEAWQKALSCYERALSEQPGLAIVRRNRALVYLRRGQHERARVELTAYLEAGPGDPDAILLLADLCSEVGEHTDALPLYERYVTDNPGDLEALFRLAQSYQAMGRQDAALLGYRHLLDRQPDFEPAKQALAALEMR